MPQTFSTALALAALVLSLVIPTVAFGQDVRELNSDGMHAFARGDFEEAAELFGRAYSLDPRPELMKNQAVAWYKAERCKDAVESAHQFLTEPTVPDTQKQEIRGLVGACKVRLAQEAIEVESFDLAEQLLADVEGADPDAVLADRIKFVRVELAKARAAAQAGREQQDQPEMTLLALDEPGVELSRLEMEEERREARAEESTEAPSARRNLGWPLIAFGLASITGGVIYHIVAASQLQPEFRDVAAAGTDRARYDELDRGLRAANVLVPTLYAVGALFTATGIFLSVSPGDSSSETKVAFGISGEF